MRLGLVGLEIRAVVREIKAKLPLKIKKIYGISRDLYSLTVRGKRDAELIMYLGGAAYLSSYRWKKPTVPPAIVMGMRKWISGGTIEGVEQLGFDRILRLRVGIGDRRFDLWVELFGGGNLLLVGEDGRILQLVRPITVRGRELRRGVEYSPPSTSSLFSEIRRVRDVEEGLRSRRDWEVWRALAYGWGVGPPYLDEVLGGEIDPRVRIAELNDDEMRRLAERVWELMKAVEIPRPTIYLDGEEPKEFSLTPLGYLRSKFEEKPFDGSFSEMLDSLLSPAIAAKLGRAESTESGSLRASAERQIALAGEYSRRARLLRRAAEEIFSRLAEFQAALDSARAGRELAGFKVDRSKGKLLWDFSGEKVSLQLHLSAAENASRLYERAKILEKKAEGARKTAEKLMKESEKGKVEIGSLIVKRESRKWFERFRWFVSSEGFLVVAGRDRSTNREIVKRYMRPRDFFLHVDMPGGSVVVVKAERNREPSEVTLMEAAVYAACYSRAWKQGLSRADVYCVRGEQVSDHAPPGMFIPKGSFYVAGERRYFHPELKLDLGLIEKEGRFLLISAPTTASGQMIAKATVVPGGIKREAAVHILKGKLESAARRVGVELTLSEEVVRSVLPPGGVEFID